MHHTMTDEDIFNLVISNAQDVSFLEHLVVDCAISNKVNAIRFVLEKASTTYNIINAITNAVSIELVDVVLSVINYTVPRYLNICLQRVKNLTILSYLLSHPRARFLVGYRQWECVRLAVLDGDFLRVNTFIINSNVDIHSAGLTTMDKTCVEIACMFDYNNIINLFIGHGLNCLNTTYSDKVQRHIITLQCDYQKKREAAVGELLNAFVNNNMVAPHSFMNSSDAMASIISPFKRPDVYHKELSHLIGTMEFI
jgi:hypothetical protein